MFKKVISLVLVLFLVFSITSCNQSQETKPSESVGEQQKTVSNSREEAKSESDSQSQTAERETQETKDSVSDSASVESLTLAVTKDENSLTPFTYVSSTGMTVNRLIYDTLFTTDLENRIIPWMVEDNYEISDGYQSFTFTLLEGQKFHDGTPLTTQDIEFSFTYPGTQNVSHQRKVCGKIAGFELKDERTMTIKLKDPDVNFLRSGLASMRIISKKQYENIADATTVHEAIGSGMYRMREYKTGKFYVLNAVDDYFKGKPRVNTLNLPIMEDRTAVQSAILSGELTTATSSIGVEMIDTFKNAKDIEIFANAGYSPMIMNINNGIAPFNDPPFRHALTYGIDVKGIMETLYGEYALVGTKNVVRSDMPYALKGLDYEFNSEKAAAILDEAGYDRKDSNGVRLNKEGKACNFEILVYSGNTPRIRTAELIAEQLKQIGIGLSVKVMEMDTVDAYVWPDFEVSKGRDYDLSMWGWGSSINPEFLVNLFSSDHSVGTYNVCGYANAEVDKIIQDQFNHATSEPELHKALEAIQEVIAKDPGLICFGYADNLQACNVSHYGHFKSGKGTNVINVFSFLGTP